MGRVAFIFPGQGAQYAGMGKELLSCSPAAKAVFDTTDSIRPGTLDQCLNGPEEALKDTSVTQPTMFTVELAAAEALKEAGISPDMTAGFSLGELVALVTAGAATVEDGFRLVCERGRLMQEAAVKYPAFMAAVMKMEPDAVKELCGTFSQVYPVNYNCPGQISVAGALEERQGFMDAVKAAGGRAVPLKVKSGFHSPFMNEASDAFGKVLEGYHFETPKIALYSDLTAEPYAEDPKVLLSKQIRSPVLWEQLIRNMIAAGADTFIECGPGTTLCGMVKRISTDVRALHVEDEKTLQETIEEVSK